MVRAALQFLVSRTTVQFRVFQYPSPDHPSSVQDTGVKWKIGGTAEVTWQVLNNRKLRRHSLLPSHLSSDPQFLHA
jgi:hypothetical protein